MIKSWKYYLAKSLDSINRLLRWIIFVIIVLLIALCIPLFMIGFVGVVAAMVLEDMNLKAKRWFNISPPEEPFDEEEIN